MNRKHRKAKRFPTWEHWIKILKLCEESLKYFERQAQVKRLDANQAKDNIRGHLKKSFHNLSLANQIFDSNQKGQFQVSYPGESFYDWVITISYYSMYQACLAVLAGVRKV